MASIDNIWGMVMWFGLAIFFMALMVTWNVLSTEVDELWEGSSKGGEIKANMQNAADQFDFILLIVWVGIHLGILTAAFLLRTHPVIYIAGIFIIGIMALLAAPLSNAYGDLSESDDLSTAITSFPKSNFIMSNLPKLEIVWGFITLIVMFGLARNEGFV